ncbi:MAG TPA: Bax inhibitor-1/YccA family protein [Bacteroidales bacterium]|nr:Bax inhibitor-1/YccA family protein [Bacteroidales bacterium]HPS49382.1 Bax inhibitor-1/YccA family protein [Bacteroidales bacterium]
MFEQSNNQYFATSGTPTTVVAKTFMTRVFGWMSLAMIVTAVTAYFFASDMKLIQSLFNFETRGMTGLGWIVTLSPIGFVLLMSFGFQRLSPAILTLLFLSFSVLMGMSLSFVLLVYTEASVFKTFAVAAVMFGIMAITGYTTKTDLTRFGSIMMMGLIGIIVAMLINIFMKSETMDYIISIIGVLVFTGLTAYDVQRLKNIGSGAGEYGDTNAQKLSILGALTLYLDFINLFIFLLRFLGDRK